MRHRTSLRAPFVITLAAATSLGCGASISSPEPDSGDAGVSADRETPTDRSWVTETDVRRGCPATLPAHGSYCAPGVDPSTCSDGSSGGSNCPPGAGVSAYCNPDTGRWQRLESSCNPPPPVRCPEMRPTDGSACPGGSYIAGAPLECEYERCAGIYVVRATCAGPTARWSVTEGSCNPPPLVDAGGVGVDF